MVGDEKPDPDRPIEEWTDNDRFINVSSSRALAREQKGPSVRLAAKACRLLGPIATGELHALPKELSRPPF
jgi:hypothetical protein